MINLSCLLQNRCEFIQNLNKLSDSRYSILASEDAIVLEKRTNLTNTSNVYWNQIKSYLINHQSELVLSDIKIIRKLEQKLLKEYVNKNKQLKISKTFDSLIENINAKVVFSDKKTVQTLPVVMRISPTPQNLRELRQNLRLFLSHFPRYQLGNSLEIYDTNSFQLPIYWDLSDVVKTLHEDYKKFTTIIKGTDTDSQFSEVELQELQELYLEAAKFLRTQIVVTVGVINETSPLGTDNTAMYVNAKEFIEAQKPLVANRNLFSVHASLWANLKKSYPFDLYLQKKGGLCVVLPQGENPETLGFKKEELLKWEYNHLNLPEATLHFAEDSRRLFKENIPDRQFLRLIVFIGHGTYPKKTYNRSEQEEGVIAGFSPSDLQKQMQVFKEHQMIFCAISSCNGGGDNAADIHLPDESIACPMILLSSLETSTYVHQNEFFPLLDHVQKELFPDGEKKSFVPKPLTKKNLKKIAERLQLNLPVFNLPSYFFPKNRADVPTTAFALIQDSSNILDVSRAAKCAPKKQLIDENSNRKAFFFSDPLIPFSITCPSSMPVTLLSRGSNIYHVMKALNLPNKDIEAIGAATFNLSDYQEVELNLNSPATKTFFMKTMQCQVEGKKKTLQHVMFKRSPNNCQIQFQVEGEIDFRRLVFVKNKKRWEAAPLFEKISLQEGIAQIYRAIDEANPSDKTLGMTTGGKLSSSELLAEFNKIFWGSPLSLNVQLLSTLLSNPLVFEKNEETGRIHRSSQLEKILEEIQQQLRISKDMPKEQELFSLLRNASDFADSMGKSLESEKIKQLTFTPLICAVMEGSLDKVKEMIRLDLSTIDTPQLNGSTPLFLACSHGHEAIARFLLKKGANPALENRFQNTPFALAAEKGSLPLMKQMLRDDRLNVKGQIGAGALTRAFRSNKGEVAAFLLQIGAGEQVDVSDLIYLVSFREKRAEFLEKLLSYPICNVNQTFKPNMTTSLFICIQKKDPKAVELLLSQGAGVDVLDLHGRSPLTHAIMFGEEQSLAIVKLLLKKEASVHSLTKEGNSLLHVAIEKENLAVIDLLLSQGALWTVENEQGQTPLEYAFKKNPELLKTLARHLSFKIDLPDGEGFTPLSRALSQGNLGLAEASINLGANIDQRLRKKPLILSYLLENKTKILPEVMEFFLTNEVLLTAQDEDGNTALHYAHLIPEEYLTQILTDYPDLLHVKNKKGETPLMYLAKQKNLFLYGLTLKKLIDKDEDILEQDIEGLLAYLLEISPIALSLVKKAFSSLPVKQRKSQAYALHAAILEDQPQILELMDKPSSTLLFGLSELMSLFILYDPLNKQTLDNEKIATLIEAGADIHTQAPDGSTLLHHAVKRGSAPIIQLLIEKGADPTLQDNEGKTPFHQYHHLSLRLMHLIAEKGWDLTGQLGVDLLKCCLRSHFLEEDKEIFKHLILCQAGS
jgi:ankyrin repeat protein